MITQGVNPVKRYYRLFSNVVSSTCGPTPRFSGGSMATRPNDNFTRDTASPARVPPILHPARQQNQLHFDPNSTKTVPGPSAANGLLGWPALKGLPRLHNSHRRKVGVVPPLRWYRLPQTAPTWPANHRPNSAKHDALPFHFFTFAPARGARSACRADFSRWRFVRLAF